MGGVGSGEIFLSLGIRGCTEIPSLVHADRAAKLLIGIRPHVHRHVCVCWELIHVSHSVRALPI